jgi:hypothetical protein
LRRCRSHAGKKGDCHARYGCCPDPHIPSQGFSGRVFREYPAGMARRPVPDRAADDCGTGTKGPNRAFRRGCAKNR